MNGISPEQLEEIRTAFAEADVEITVLSCYRDLSSPDDGTRTAAVADVCRALHYQKATGAKQVGSRKLLPISDRGAEGGRSCPC